MYENFESITMETLNKFNNLPGDEKFLTLMGKNMSDRDS